jgi:ATP-dependent exoDNAse (exonuclease V) alpha subunit
MPRNTREEPFSPAQEGRRASGKVREVAPAEERRHQQFTAPDKSLGVANRDLATIQEIHPDDRLSARLDNNRQIEFNASEHRHFDHGYAVTSHSSQGLTAERVLVHADTSVHPDLLNSRFGYVSISRASHQATLFTDDMAKLRPQLGADVSKTSALEITQASSIAQGIRMGLG